MQQFYDFVPLFAETKHDSRLDENLRVHFLRRFQQTERGRVVGLESNGGIKAPHGLNVVREDIRLRVNDRSDGVERTLKIRGQEFNLHVRIQLTNLAYSFRENHSAAIFQIVAVD